MEFLKILFYDYFYFQFILTFLPQSLSEATFIVSADHTCIYYQHEDIHKIDSILNTEFIYLCDSQLSIHLEERKTKAILFTRSKTMLFRYLFFYSYFGHTLKNKQVTGRTLHCHNFFQYCNKFVTSYFKPIAAPSTLVQIWHLVKYSIHLSKYDYIMSFYLY